MPGQETTPACKGLDLKAAGAGVPVPGLDHWGVTNLQLSGWGGLGVRQCGAYILSYRWSPNRVETTNWVLRAQRTSDLQDTMRSAKAMLVRGTSVADAAAELGYSHANGLSRAFRTAEGVTISGWLISNGIIDDAERMRLAAEELILPDVHTLTQIADMVGYPSMKAMGEAFRRTYGMYPKQWRHWRLKAGLRIMSSEDHDRNGAA